MPDNKIIVRRLPPSMKEEDFLKEVSPLPRHDYFCFFEASSGLGPHAYSRAYINFLNSSDMDSFREKYDNHVFLSKDGREYPAVVENALWHKSPKSGPFYISNSTQLAESEDQATSEVEKDPDFTEFLERLENRKKGPQNSLIQTLEANLDELTNLSNAGPSHAGKVTKIITPLIGYVNQKRTSKSQKKTR